MKDDKIPNGEALQLPRPSVVAKPPARTHESDFGFKEMIAQMLC